MKKLFLFIALLFATCAWGEDFTIAGGGGVAQGSTYSHMIGTIGQTCSTAEMQIKEKTTTGSDENVKLITNNQVDGAIIQNDFLAAAKMQNPKSVANVRTVFALHPEEVHFIARADVKTEGGVTIGGFNLGGDKIQFNQLDDLRDRAVGAVGGSLRTGQIISEYLKLGLKMTSYASTTAMLTDLLSKKIDAILIVSGAPSAAVEALDSRYKMLSVRGNQDIANVYAATKVQYSKLNNGNAVDTVATQALLVSRVFRSPEMQVSLAKLRTCLTENLVRIQDARGSHPKWQDVKVDDHGKWEWYELPTVGGTAVKSTKR